LTIYDWPQANIMQLLKLGTYLPQLVFKVVPGKDAAAVRALADHPGAQGSPQLSQV
jgi:acyl-CoA reductase-like NAD-dependent aldehyde dehydrogenase